MLVENAGEQGALPLSCFPKSLGHGSYLEPVPILNRYWSILDLSPHHGNKPWVLSLERLMVDFTFDHWFLGWGNCYLVICGHRPLQWVNRMLVHDGDMFRPQYSALLYHWKNLVCHFIVFNFLLLHYFWNWEGRNKTAFVHRCRDCLWENPKESVKKSSWN